MNRVRSGVGSWLERRRADAFIAGGVLLLASPGHVGLERFVGVPLPSWLVALLVVPGVIASLVGVAGLYPRLAIRTPRAALVAGVLAAIAGGSLVVLLCWVLASSISMSVFGIPVSTPPDVGFVFVSATVSATFVLFGVAWLWAGAPTRPVGILLVSFALPWLAAIGATAVYGSSVPDWLAMAIYGPIPLLTVATGYALRLESPPADFEDAVDTLTPG
jgi:hypothetical protein